MRKLRVAQKSGGPGFWRGLAIYDLPACMGEGPATTAAGSKLDLPVWVKRGAEAAVKFRPKPGAMGDEDEAVIRREIDRRVFFDSIATAMAQNIGRTGKGELLEVFAGVVGPADVQTPGAIRGELELSMMIARGYFLAGMRDKARAVARVWEPRMAEGKKMRQAFGGFEVILPLAHAGDFEEAERMLEMQPDFMVAAMRKLFVREAAEAGDKERAKKYLVAALAVEEREFTGKRSQAYLCGMAGEWDKALVVIKGMDDEHKEMGWSYAAQGFWGGGDKASERKAMQERGKLANVTPVSSVAIFRMIGDLEQARDTWKKEVAGKAEGDDPRHWWAAAGEAARIGELEDAKKLIERARGDVKYKEQVGKTEISNMARDFYKAGDDVTGEALLAEAFKLEAPRPGMPGPSSQVGEIVRWDGVKALVARGEIEKATAWSKKFERVYPWGDEALAVLMEELAKRGNVEEVKALSGKKQTLANLQYMAWALAAGGKIDELEAQFAKLTKTEEQAYFCLGVIKSEAAKVELPRGLTRVYSMVGGF